MYAKWIQSWRDLPVLINQWANIVRWEKVTRLFLRTTEFLWQEGHTAHETAEEAEEETLKILALYKEFVETELAIPVIAGRKSESEKFAGARPHVLDRGADGRRPRAAGRHVAQPRPELRQGLRHQVPGPRQVAAVHLGHVVGDDHPAHRRASSWCTATSRGLVLPPRVAPYQVVIVPIPRGNWRETVLPHAQQLRDTLVAAGVRVMLDDRDAYTPGWKFSEWELRGVPLRLEIGPKDIEKQQVMLARRDTREKLPTPVVGLAGRVQELLAAIQKNLFDRALAFQLDHTSRAATWDEFTQVMEGRPGFVIAPWCGDAVCEADVKAATQATIRNLPMDAAPAAGAPCVKCGRPSVADAWFAKAY